MVKEMPTSAWTEIQIDDDSISLTLVTEGMDGARVEDTARFTFEELQDKAGDIESLRISDDTREAWGDAFRELDEDSIKERVGRHKDVPEPSISVGDTMVDKSPPEWSDYALVEVAEVTDTPAEFWPYSPDGGFADKTIADKNPDYPASDRVILAKYVLGGDKEYAFPASRLRHLKENDSSKRNHHPIWDNP